MIKIFIIDDETPVRQWLRFCIERAGSEFEVAGEFSNAEDGLKALKSVRADIAILDIMMPGLNGLEALPKLREENPGLNIIMMTNYAEFEYIQKAVRRGAAEYFLKSEITEEDLRNCLNKIASQIKKTSLLMDLSQEAESKVVTRLCERILNGSIPDRSSFQEALAQYPIPLAFTKNLFVIALCHPANATLPFSDIPAGNLSEYLSTLHIYRHTPFHTYFICEMASLSSHLIIFNSIARMLARITREIPYYYVGVSNIYQNFSDLFNGITEASLSMNSGFYKKEGSVTYIYETHNASLDQDILADDSRRLVNIAKLKSYDELKLELSLVFDYFDRCRPNDPESIKEYCLELIYLIRSVYMSNTQTFQLLGEDMGHGIRRRIQDCFYLSELHRAMEKTLLDFYSNTQAPETYSAPVSEAISYIKDHYTENLTLREVAGHVHINADYLGKLFKKETGYSFNTYVTSIKMEYADYLIRNTNLKKYEIAEKLGYTNFSYFSRVYSDYKKLKSPNT